MTSGGRVQSKVTWTLLVVPHRVITENVGYIRSSGLRELSEAEA